MFRRVPLYALLALLFCASAVHAYTAQIDDLYPLTGDEIWEGTDVINEAGFTFTVNPGEPATTFWYRLQVEKGHNPPVRIYDSGEKSVTVQPGQTVSKTLKWTMNNAQIGWYDVLAGCGEDGVPGSGEIDSNSYDVVEVEEP